MMTVPLKYILTLALVSAATGAPTSIARPAASNVTVARMMPNTNFPAGDLPGKDHEFPPGTKPEACQALCDKTPECHAWTFLKRGGPGGQGMSCCIKGPIISDPWPATKASTSTTRATLPPHWTSRLPGQCQVSDASHVPHYR
jgi:hypothetical protein